MARVCGTFQHVDQTELALFMVTVQEFHTLLARGAVRFIANWAIGGVGAQAGHTVHTWWSRAIRFLAHSSICHADRSICQNWFWLCVRNSLWNLFIKMFNKRR